MTDLKAFFTMNYGMYLVSAKAGERASGCVVNTLSQVTAEPLQMTVAIHKENLTTELIRESGHFAAVVLSQEAGMDLIGVFGFQSGRDRDKFAGFPTRQDEDGVPYVCRHVVARFSCQVTKEMDMGTHVLFLGRVTAAEILSDELPLTYTQYHEVKKGKTPPKASSYLPPQQAGSGYRCKICGYILEGDRLPADFVCPVCGRGPEAMERL